MKKLTALFATIACALSITNSSFTMLFKHTLRTKKIHSFSTDTKELRLQRVQVVRARHLIRENNNNLMKYMTEQNKVLDQIEEWGSKPRTQFEFSIAEDEMTALAQKLLELEQQKKLYYPKE